MKELSAEKLSIFHKNVTSSCFKIIRIKKKKHFYRYYHYSFQTEEEIAELENDIRGIEEAIRNKIRPTKKAETRLENRTYRPNVELCRDAAQYGLVDEVKQLYATKNALEEKLKQAQYVLTYLLVCLPGCLLAYLLLFLTHLMPLPV